MRNCCQQTFVLHKPLGPTIRFPTTIYYIFISDIRQYTVSVRKSSSRYFLERKSGPNRSVVDRSFQFGTKPSCVACNLNRGPCCGFVDKAGNSLGTSNNVPHICTTSSTLTSPFHPPASSHFPPSIPSGSRTLRTSINTHKNNRDKPGTRL